MNLDVRHLTQDSRLKNPVVEMLRDFFIVSRRKDTDF